MKLEIRNNPDKEDFAVFPTPFVSAFSIALCIERLPVFGGLLWIWISQKGG